MKPSIFSEIGPLEKVFVYSPGEEHNLVLPSDIKPFVFEKDKIVENARVFLGAIKKARPQAAKGIYMKKATITSTMGPGVKLDILDI